jgi:hypothetical protein
MTPDRLASREYDPINPSVSEADAQYENKTTMRKSDNIREKLMVVRLVSRSIRFILSIPYA